MSRYHKPCWFILTAGWLTMEPLFGVCNNSPAEWTGKMDGAQAKTDAQPVM